MKLSFVSLLLMLFLLFMPVNSNEIDCTQFKKFSKKYLECNANKLKEKTNEDKLKKFKNSKTLKDLIKN